jgi:hypothetical protein
MRCTPHATADLNLFWERSARFKLDYRATVVVQVMSCDIERVCADEDFAAISFLLILEDA